MKDNSKVNAGADFDFGPREAQVREFAQILPIGQHVVTVDSVGFEYSNGKTDEDGEEVYSDRMPTIIIGMSNDDGEIRYYISTRALVRFSELNEEHLEDIDPADLGIKPDKWAIMDLVEKIEASFDKYLSPEKEFIAIRKTDNSRLYEPRNSKRTNDMLGKLDSLVEHCGNAKGTKYTPKNLAKFVVNKEVGIEVVTGLRNQKGRAMSKVAYTLDPSEVEGA